MTDKKLSQMDPVKVTLESLDRAGIPFQLYDNCRVEPSEDRWSYISFTLSLLLILSLSSSLSLSLSLSF